MLKKLLNLEGKIAPLNSLLLAAAMLVVGYSLYNSLFNWEAYTLKTGGALSMGEKLHVYALGILGAGLSFSILVVNPFMRHNSQERSQMDKRAQTFMNQANTDPLTGMHNRRYFERALSGYLNRHSPSGMLFEVRIA